MTDVLIRSTRTTPRDQIGPVLRALIRPVSGIACVYLGGLKSAAAPLGARGRLRTPHPALDPVEDLELRHRALLVRLIADGVDEPTHAAVAARLTGTDPLPTELAVFARDGRIVLEQPVPGGAHLDRAGFTAPADLVPLLAWRQRHPAYVLVVTDRTGADIVAVPDGSTHGTTEVVVGPDDEIERNAPGGWAQPRYQRRAEDSWRHNAAAVARAAGRALHGVRAGLLLVAGDVRAVQLLRDDLAGLAHHGLTVRHVPGGRSPDGSAGNRAAAVAEAVATHHEHRTAALVAALQRHAGPRGTAALGVRDSLAALAAGQAGTLFVGDADDARTAWFGPDPLCAVDRVPGMLPGRLVDVAVRAALLTDADVRVVPAGTVPEDIAVLRRFT